MNSEQKHSFYTALCCLVACSILAVVMGLKSPTTTAEVATQLEERNEHYLTEYLKKTSPGDILKMNGDYLLITAVTGDTLTVNKGFGNYPIEAGLLAHEKAEIFPMNDSEVHKAKCRQLAFQMAGMPNGVKPK